MQLRGLVVTGQGLGRHFTSLPWAHEQFVKHLGIDPYPGTLNLRLTEPRMRQRWAALRRSPGEVLRAGEPGNCDAYCFHVDVNGSQTAAIIWPQVDAYPDDQLELIAGCNLRLELGLIDGTEVRVRVVSRAEALRRTVQAYLRGSF